MPCCACLAVFPCLWREPLARQEQVLVYKQSTDPICRCSICQLDLEPTDEVCVLPCNHVFHTECIQQWLAQRKVSCVCAVACGLG